jgi:hypothetical protein
MTQIRQRRGSRACAKREGIRKRECAAAQGQQHISTTSHRRLLQPLARPKSATQDIYHIEERIGPVLNDKHNGLRESRPRQVDHLGDYLATGVDLHFTPRRQGYGATWKQSDIV